MNVLAFFAHPDDETMLSGGVLALLAECGMQVHYLCATRGEGGEVGEPPCCPIDELGGVREKELACAVQVLGGQSLAFLDYIDPRVGPDDQLFAYTLDMDGLTLQVADFIRSLQIDVVITHGSNGEYGHPAHVISYQAALRAVEAMEAGAPLLYSVVADFPDHPKRRLTNQDQPAHIILDIAPVLEKKIQAALCHRTQNALFVRRTSKASGRKMTIPEVIVPLESLHRVVPSVYNGPDDALTRILQPWARLSE